MNSTGCPLSTELPFGAKGRTAEGEDGNVVGGEGGFALASVLMLVTILSILAFSVLALLYLERESAYIDISRVKAEYAAQSGVACIMGELENAGVPSIDGPPRSLTFGDGSTADVTLSRWGICLLVQSKGKFRNAETTRQALVGQWPANQFSHALILGNAAHQIVLTGTSSVIGDVLVGPGGATTGSITGYSTPVSLPISGTIIKGNQPSLPECSSQTLNKTIDYFLSWSKYSSAGDAIRGTDPAKGPDTPDIPDTVHTYVVGATSPLPTSISRPSSMLYITSTAGMKIDSTARLVGLVTIISSDTILIDRGASLHGCVIVGLKGITVRSNGLSSVQLLSSRIQLQSGTRCTYPSVALSLPFDTSQTRHQEFVMQSGATLEGLAGLISPRGDDVLDIEEGAHVTGAAYSSARMTLDGSVTGSVLAYDFYFYEAPSIYLGWLRKGTVNRPALPRGFLVPPIFGGGEKPGILDWL